MGKIINRENASQVFFTSEKLHGNYAMDEIAWEDLKWGVSHDVDRGRIVEKEFPPEGFESVIEIYATEFPKEIRKRR